MSTKISIALERWNDFKDRIVFRDKTVRLAGNIIMLKLGNS